ncbi:adenylate/guanylate cyclase domain-containing protein [Myxacorys almedinensis]|uniref:Adenylate/guanylate cyclase domain-containing protein n=1 Tax=Myxacorys almedinensis A TaxID=2690445 RepID=A0A8J7Z2F4_9CYAN|nr:adenylate/guanylate cyclase domain-containing protein [Myxacorys almedinensis]NDJ19137.1 adenylate/guanylate cyclase domain-containing protein [Myxacorys almedinensis A]
MQKINKHNSRSTLEQLLFKRRFASEVEYDTIDQEIQDIFSQTQAVLVLDMSGFSKTTVQQGIIATLTVIQHMQSIVIPTVMTYCGTVIKLDADNVFAVLPDVDFAVQAAIEIFRRLNAAGLHASIGIGYGDMLIIEGSEPYSNDLYGSEVNFASKLGEDIAGIDELLLTEAAFKKLYKPDISQWKQVEFEISNVTIAAWGR